MIGRDVDRAKYAALAEEVRARQAAAAQTAAEQASGDPSERSRRARSYAAYQRRREARRRNIALERFKFWLGLPNKCVEWGQRDEGGRVAGPEVGSGCSVGDEWCKHLRAKGITNPRSVGSHASPMLCYRNATLSPPSAAGTTATAATPRWTAARARLMSRMHEEGPVHPSSVPSSSRAAQQHQQKGCTAAPAALVPCLCLPCTEPAAHAMAEVPCLPAHTSSHNVCHTFGLLPSPASL